MNDVEKFCETMDTKYLHELSDDTREFFIAMAYTCLSQKYGRQEIAKKVLLHYEEIIENNGYLIYKGKKELTSLERLIRTGVTTIPVIDEKNISKYRQKFIQTLREFPEYNRDPKNPDLDGKGNPLVYVLGGFAALGNPASFHNKFVRKLRLKAKEKVKPLFRTVIKSFFREGDYKLEMLIDRMMYRMKSQAPPAESWHRDVIPGNMLEKGDELFGGWINLDKTNQYFSCIPGSHLGIDQKTLTPGFATVPKELVKIVSSYKKKIVVPPGHMVIFPQYILHEVVSNKASYDMMRLFTGWRVTTSCKYLHKNMEKLLDTQSIIPLPGGCIPPMHASNHGSFFLRKQFKPIPRFDHKVNLIEWSRDTMQSRTLVRKNDYRVVKRYMDSLESYGFPLYTAYTEDEKNEYKPKKI